jgi:predicted outer membrane lipoprotein
MNHAITLGGLLLSIGLLGGVLTCAFGVLSLFANMMADAQGDGGKGGCIALIVGAVLVIGCGIGLVL